jgi:hypothetical protein
MTWAKTERKRNDRLRLAFRFLRPHRLKGLGRWKGKGKANRQATIALLATRQWGTV